MIALSGAWTASADRARSIDNDLWWSWSNVAPFVSVAAIMGALFFVAFGKMEVRRLGYSVWKLSREERNLRDLDRDLQIQLAKAVRPEHLARVAEGRLTLRRAEKGQIVQMTEAGVALEQ